MYSLSEFEEYCPIKHDNPECLSGQILVWSKRCGYQFGTNHSYIEIDGVYDPRVEIGYKLIGARKS